jgi:D-3-phosphoglycerate dehydrogenase
MTAPPGAAPKVATIGHRFPDAAIEAAVLEPLGIAVEWLGPLPKPEAMRAARDAGAVLLGAGYALDASDIARLAGCRVIVRYGVGVDNIDVAAAAERGVTVCNVPDYGVEEVADHALALLLLFARRLDLWPQAVRAGSWGAALPAVRMRRLSRTTLGVIGAGRIGRALISRAVPIWGRVVASDPYVPPETLAALGAAQVSLDDLLAESEFVSLHVPSDPSTRGLLGAREFARMKPGAVLVNCSRGDVLDELALADAIRAGRIAGAGLDVFGTEPPPPHGLVALPQVWPTPHVAFLSVESVIDLRRRAAEEAGRVLTGAAPLHPVAAAPQPQR